MKDSLENLRGIWVSGKKCIEEIWRLAFEALQGSYKTWEGDLSLWKNICRAVWRNHWKNHRFQTQIPRKNHKRNYWMKFWRNPCRVIRMNQWRNCWRNVQKNPLKNHKRIPYEEELSWKKLLKEELERFLIVIVENQEEFMINS